MNAFTDSQRAVLAEHGIATSNRGVMTSNAATPVEWLEADYDDPGRFREPVYEEIHTLGFEEGIA